MDEGESIHNSSSISSKRIRRETSAAWNAFDKLPTDGDIVWAQCKWCPQKYISGHGTSNMLRHAKECAKNREQGHSYRPPLDQAKYREKLSVAIVKHDHPFSFVEQDGIRDLHEFLNPEVIHVSRNTIKSDILKMYGSAKLYMKSVMENIPGRVCLTSDLWSSVTSDGYMTLTAHYVDHDWNLDSKLLSFYHPLPPHSGDHLAMEIIQLLKEWGIEKKVFTITLDNASYNKRLEEYLKRHLDARDMLVAHGLYFRIRCANHVFNLIVKAGLEIIERGEQSCVVKIRECVKYVRASEERLIKFAECATIASVSCYMKVILDVVTRWNSTFEMLMCAIHYKKAFLELKVSDRGFKICPSEEEWAKVEIIAEFLEPFFDLTVLFSGSAYPTANLYFRGVWKIEKYLIDHSSHVNDDIKAMAVQMHRKFQKYWKNYSTILGFAVILDPRFKIQYLSHALKKIDSLTYESKVKELLEKLHKLFAEYAESSSTQPSTSTQPVDSSSDRGMRILHDDLEEFESQEERDVTKSELDLYLEETRQSVKQELDVLKYWRDNRTRFPQLSLMARDILSIPITTVKSESSFSTGGRIIGKYRTSLLPENVEALICTRNWLHGHGGEISLFIFTPPTFVE